MLKTDKLGNAVAQACLSVTRMSRVVEKAHNSKNSWGVPGETVPGEGLYRSHDSMKDGIQGAHTSADVWRVKKRIAAQVSRARAKAYG